MPGALYGMEQAAAKLRGKILDATGKGAEALLNAGGTAIKHIAIGAGKGAVNLAGRRALGGVLAVGAMGAIGAGAMTVANRYAQATELPPFSNVPAGPVRSAIDAINPVGAISYDVARYNFLNPGFAIALGIGAAAGTASYGLSSNKALPPHTMPQRIQRGEHPYNLGASGDMVFAAHNMR